MIVKNEEKVIERVLRSVLPTVDRWCIVDTGSTDQTKSVIRRVALELRKPGHIYSRRWVDFGHNRSEALTLAKNHMKWCLMMDADDSLEGDAIDSSKFDKNSAGYYVLIKHGNTIFRRSQIFNLSFDWYYTGVVHEYADCRTAGWYNKPFSSDTWIRARTEGCRSRDPQKYQKDAMLLQRELDKPNCRDRARVIFMLAQSYRDSDNKEQAIKYYKKRSVLSDSWLEERYLSYLNLIRLTTAIEDKIKYAWAAQNLLPTRKECVGAVLRDARLAGIFTQELYAMGLAFKDVKLPEDGLILEPDVYRWSYDEDFAFEAQHTGHLHQAVESFKLSLSNCPDWAKDIMSRSLQNAVAALGRST